MVIEITRLSRGTKGVNRRMEICRDKPDSKIPRPESCTCYRGKMREDMTLPPIRCKGCGAKFEHTEQCSPAEYLVLHLVGQNCRCRNDYEPQQVDELASAAPFRASSAKHGAISEHYRRCGRLKEMILRRGGKW